MFSLVIILAIPSLKWIEYLAWTITYCHLPFSEEKVVPWQLPNWSTVPANIWEINVVSFIFKFIASAPDGNRYDNFWWISEHLALPKNTISEKNPSGTT